MSTRKQREANVRNAQFSSGPKTEAGRAASSRNSVTHGVCVSDLALRNDLETEAGFQARLDEYFDFHQPASPGERDAIEDIVFTRVRLRRALRAETGLLDDARNTLYNHVEARPDKNGDILPYFSLDGVPDDQRRILSNRLLGLAWEKVAQTIDRLSRYESRLAARLEKSKRELAALQFERKNTPEPEPPPPPPEPPQPTVQNEPNSDLTPVVAIPVQVPEPTTAAVAPLAGAPPLPISNPAPPVDAPASPAGAPVSSSEPTVCPLS